MANVDPNGKGNVQMGSDTRKHMPSKSYLIGGQDEVNGQQMQQMDGQMIGNAGGQHHAAQGSNQFQVSLNQYAGAKQLSRSNTVDGKVQPAQDVHDPSGQGWQAGAAHGVTVG